MNKLITDEDVAFIKKNGYLIVKNVFPKEQIEELYQKGFKISRQTKNPEGDISSFEGFRDIAFSPKMIEIAKKILGEKIVYFGDSSLNLTPAKGVYHKDSRFDYGDPRYTEYPIYRFATYLQDHSRHSGGIKIQPGSHKRLYNKDLLRNGFWHCLLNKKLKKSDLGFRKNVNLLTEPGDVAIWNLRTLHAGGGTSVIRGFPKLSFSPTVDRYLPSFVKYPHHKQRVTIFCVYGAPSEALDQYIQNRVTRPQYKEFWKKSSFGKPEIKEMLESRGVTVRLDCLQDSMETVTAS